jgi:hypothetical protein
MAGQTQIPTDMREPLYVLVAEKVDVRCWAETPTTTCVDFQTVVLWPEMFSAPGDVRPPGILRHLGGADWRTLQDVWCLRSLPAGVDWDSAAESISQVMTSGRGWDILSRWPHSVGDMDCATFLRCREVLRRAVIRMRSSRKPHMGEAGHLEPVCYPEELPDD